MTIVSSKNWRATEATDFAGGDRKLVVTGEVELSRLDLLPRLKEATPQGKNPSILLLELSDEQHGDAGGDATKWEAVAFEKAIEQHQYAKVDIVGQVSVDVEEVIS